MEQPITPAIPVAPQPAVMQVGLVRAAPLAVVMEEERAAAQELQAQPMIQSLAAHIRKCWQIARDAKQMTVEPRMLQSVRARRGEYDPDKLAAIREQGGSEIYANLTSVKCRAAASWIRDVLLGTGGEKAWGIKPTPMPDLPPQIGEAIVQMATEPIKQSIMQGNPMSEEQIRQMLAELRDQAINEIKSQARQMAERMEMKMEDQLIEGGFIKALDEFIDDIVTFPAAILKGPIIRKKATMRWVPQGGGKYVPEVEDVLKIEFERVDPFMLYPSPQSADVDDGFIIEKHRLSRRALNEMVGVDGYSDSTIRLVLDDYGRGGLREWLTNDMAIASAEGKSMTAITQNPEGLIDALQFWGSVQGQMLIDWGMDKDEIPDPTKEYDVEAWLIGSYVIKATLNPDPMRRKPYFKASYEEVPGTFWGNSPADLVRDCQTVVNASARGIVNNAGIASGPQVIVNVDRLAPGEEVTQLTPWRIWQVTNDPMGSNSSPIDFFSPNSHIAELAGIFDKFSQMADEYSGIPRYLSGETSGGAGRTASGLSMLINNAGKSIKQVISNIDVNVMTPLIERLYNHNMQHSDDPELKGDVHIVARGASALIAKEAAQVRRNEFLQATANPIDMQIVGVQGRATILREVAKGLDLDVDKIVPPLNVLQQKLIAQQMAQQQQPQQQGPQPTSPSGQELQDGAPVTDNFSPPRG